MGWGLSQTPPPGSFHPCGSPRKFLPPLGFSTLGGHSPPTLFQFVARFARVRFGDSVGTGSRQRHISHGGKLPGGKTGVETSGGESSGHHIYIVM